MSTQSTMYNYDGWNMPSKCIDCINSIFHQHHNQLPLAIQLISRYIEEHELQQKSFAIIESDIKRKSHNSRINNYLLQQ